MMQWKKNRLIFAMAVLAAKQKKTDQKLPCGCPGTNTKAITRDISSAEIVIRL